MKRKDIPYTKAICPSCKKERWLKKCTLFGIKPAMKCTKCGYAFQVSK